MPLTVLAHVLPVFYMYCRLVMSLARSPKPQTFSPKSLWNGKGCQSRGPTVLGPSEVQPNVISYNAAISAAAVESRWQSAMELFRHWALVIGLW